MHKRNRLSYRIKIIKIEIFRENNNKKFWQKDKNGEISRYKGFVSCVKT